MKSSHDEPRRGHFAYKSISHKVLHSIYYWLTLFKNSRKYVKSCDAFQRMWWLINAYGMPLNTQVLVKTIEKLALEFVGTIILMLRKKIYILVFIDYVTKWVEAKSFLKDNEQVVDKFLYEYIFTWFRVPRR